MINKCFVFIRQIGGSEFLSLKTELRDHDDITF